MPQSDPFPHYIEFRHVYKTFDRPVLVDSNFTSTPGETVAIIGRSGVGKIRDPGPHHGLPQARQGRVIVAHEDITDFSEKRAAPDPQEGDDGVPVRRAVRLADGRPRTSCFPWNCARTTTRRTRRRS